MREDLFYSYSGLIWLEVLNFFGFLLWLKFASAAKRMKNDPHVTEVSDEGALLRRYRNEIVDLRRRLQEVRMWFTYLTIIQQ